MSEVVVRLIGGLGNQMFQYAAGKALATKKGARLKLDVADFEQYTLRRFELGVFANIDAVLAQPADLLRYGRTQVKGSVPILAVMKKHLGLLSAGRAHVEPYFHYDPGWSTLQGDVYLDGYWQSERYFSEITSQIRDDFTMPPAPDAANKLMDEQIDEAPVPVAVHVRRGDYVSNPEVAKFHGTCSLDYYSRAMDKLADQFQNTTFFLFTDDPDWVKGAFPKRHRWVVANVNSPERGWADMRLMSRCHHHVIANSSFSWWGAWLGGYPDKRVIAPSRWFAQAPHDTSDLLPGSWSRM